ncbi:MAG: hypothetical protein O3B86_18130, partial [Planctomycetota bacterium]|nr:hypothetical protein [Planctomycetota bacterium]
RVALETTGPPIVQATLITGLGMLALGLSNFGPTVRFGLLMTASLGVALIGDLILLPCLLYLRPSTNKARQVGKSHATSSGSKRWTKVPTPHIGKPRRPLDSIDLDDEDAAGCIV